MAQITVSINNHSFPVSCDDGEEERVMDLARYVNQHVSDLAQQMGQVGDARLLLMASLIIADELAEAVTALEELKANPPTPAIDLETVTARIEQVAEQLKPL